MSDYGTGSFTLANLADPATTRLFVGNLTMHSEAPNAAPVVPEFVDDAVGGDASRQLGLFECSVDICPKSSPPASPAPVDSGNDDVFCWNPGDSDTVEDHNTGTRLLLKFHSIPPSEIDEGPEESIVFVYGKLGSGNDDGWCMAQTIDPVESDYSGTHLLYQDVFVPAAVQGVGTPTDADWLLV